MSGCDECKYSRMSGKDLECHRTPPPWLRVSATDWCGEFVFIEMGHKFNSVSEILQNMGIVEGLE